MTISFKVSKEDLLLIGQIAERAQSQIFSKYPDLGQTVADTMMDLSACIAQGVPLRLDDLLAADASNFAHDVVGIRRHINRETGKLEGCFLPRFFDRDKAQ